MKAWGSRGGLSPGQLLSFSGPGADQGRFATPTPVLRTQLQEHLGLVTLAQGSLSKVCLLVMGAGGGEPECQVSVGPSSRVRESVVSTGQAEQLERWVEWA